MSDYALTMRILPGEYAVARLRGGESWAHTALRAGGDSLAARIITGWDDTLVCLNNRVPHAHADAQRGFRALAVVGTLDFALTGIISRISAALAEREISVFVISTYDTDCVLVRSDRLADAVEALRAAGIAVWWDTGPVNA